MKLAKRISIALLAACVVGGSGLAMTACGGGEPETPSSDPIPVVSQDVSSEEEVNDVAVDAVASQDDQTDSVTEEAMSFRDAYVNDQVRLADYGGDRFGNTAFLQIVEGLKGDSSATTTGLFANIGEDWELTEFEVEQRSLTEDDWMMPADVTLPENETDVGLYGYVNWDASDKLISEQVAVYFSYDEMTHTVHTYKLVTATIGADAQPGTDSINVYLNEEAHNKLLELMDARN